MKLSTVLQRLTRSKLIMHDDPAGLPSLKALRVFEVAAKQLNFRLAADELKVTQAAVAHQVRRLESELGLKLFDRLPRGLALTHAGRRYQERISQAFSIIREATHEVTPAPSHVTISVPPTFASKWLMPRLPAFSKTHPQIELRLLSTERLSDFQGEGVDIAVRYGNPPFGAGLNAELLFEQRVVLVGSPSLLADSDAPESMADLQKYVLLYDAHDFWPEYLSQSFSGELGEFKKMRLNNTSLAIDAALAGQGLALVTRSYVEPELASGRLLAMAADLVLESGFYLVWPRKPQRSETMSNVRRWLRDQATVGSQ